MNTSNDFFSGLFEDRPIKTIGVVSAVASGFVYIPMFVGIVWFERFGSDKKRTILNKLVSSICYLGIFYLIVLQPLEKLRYILGPLPVPVCVAHFVLYNSLIVQGPVLP